MPSLDGVRGVAILLVLVHHFGVPADLPHRSTSFVSQWFERVLFVGWAGVDLFFVLSGFLITTILLVSRDEPHYFLHFYSRRVLRIFPLYYFTLVLGLLVLPQLIPERTSSFLGPTSDQIWLWTYTLNIGLALGLISIPGVFAHFWTLAIEEQYYLVWPWLVRIMSTRSLLRLCGVVILTGLAFRIAWVGLGLESLGAYRFTLTRADSLAFGGAVAILVRDRAWKDWLLKWALFGLACGLSLNALIFFSVRQFYPTEWIVVTIGHSILAFTSACLVVVALRAPTRGWLASGHLQMLGKYSYGIYVWHWPLQQVLLSWYRTRLVEPSLAAFSDALLFLTVGIIGSVVLGWMSYHLIEAPFLRVKRLFGYAKVEPMMERSSPEPLLAPSGPSG